MKPFAGNPSARVSVILNIYGASDALKECLGSVAGASGLRRFLIDWPDERLRREVPGFTEELSQEWKALLARREARFSKLR